MACALAGALASVACGPGPHVVPVECRSLPGSAGGAVPVQATDTLPVEIRIDSLDTSERGHLMVRVDPLDEAGVVHFEQPPPATTAAVGMALTTAGIFEGCFHPTPGGFRLRAPEAPRSRVWVRVSTGRPVKVTLVRGEDPAPVAAPLVVAPGTSGQIAWSAPETSP